MNASARPVPGGQAVVPAARVAAPSATPSAVAVGAFLLVHSDSMPDRRVVGLPHRCCVFAWSEPDVADTAASGQAGIGRFALRLRGIEARALLAISVLDGARVVYDMTSAVGHSGQTATAGEMILAMAALRGQPGMWIDAGDLSDDPLLNRLSLVVHLRAPVCTSALKVDAVSMLGT